MSIKIFIFFRRYRRISQLPVLSEPTRRINPFSFKDLIVRMIVLLPFSVRLTISATLMELLSLILRSYTFPILLYYIFKIISSRNTHPRMKNSVV